MSYMYILECADGSYYTGSTKDLERRLWEHQNGLGANHTAKRLPVKLVYCEECDRIDDAFYREKQVQGWSRKKKEALMASDTNQLHMLAECKNESASTSLSDRSRARSLSCRVSGVEPGVEGNNTGSDNLARSLSGVETLEVVLEGEITSLKSTRGDSLTFQYIDSGTVYNLGLFPSSGKNTKNYVKFYKEKVRVTAVVERISMYKKPKLHLLEIEHVQFILDLDHGA